VAAILLSTVLTTGCGTSAEKSPKVGTSADSAASRSDSIDSIHWLTNLDEAKRVAAAEGKDLFINFTGLSWCGPCMQLEYEVLTTAAFAPSAQHFVMVRLDYPSGVRRLPQEPPDSQLTWRDYYAVNSFPTVFLADATGLPYAVTGNNGLKAGPYLKHIHELRGVHAVRDAGFAKAAQADGVDRAKLLFDGLTAMRKTSDPEHSGSGDDLLVHFYRKQMDEVVQLDADGAAGLRGQIDEILRAMQKRAGGQDFYAQLQKTFTEQGVDASLRILDEKILDAESIEHRNELRRARLTYLEWGNRIEDALAFARELAVDENLTANEQFTNRRRVAANLWQLKRHEDALREYDKLIAESEGNPWRASAVLREKAGILRENGRFAEALSAYECAIKLLEPKTEQWRIAVAWRINLLARLGRADDAWEAWGNADEIGWRRPLDGTSMMAMIAHYLNERGLHEAALAAAARAEKALDDFVAESDAERKTVADLRQTLDKVKAGPAAKTNRAERTIGEESK
jgi:tetratricopeptide (TPR) repeat protein